LVDLDETPSATLGVDLAESLLLEPLVHDTHRADEQGNDDAHEPVDGCEDVVQCVITELDDRRLATIADIGDSGAESSGSREQIRCIGVATALERILNGNLFVLIQCCPDITEVASFLESPEPDR